MMRHFIFLAFLIIIIAHARCASETFHFPRTVISRKPCDMDPQGCPLHKNRNVICLHECWLTADFPPKSECANKYYMEVGCYAK